MKRACIVGTGRYVPERVVTNADLAKIVDTSDEWIVTRTGIRERHHVDDEMTSDLAAGAGKQALEAAGISGADLDLIIVATVTPDTPMPACAVHVQQKLGATCPAFDISAACAGWPYGLAVGSSMIESGFGNNVLVIGAETLSSVTNWNDRTTCILFGDGSGAVVLQGRESDESGPGILANHLGSDGSLAKELIIPAGGTAMPSSAQTAEESLHAIQMNGRAIFGNAVREMSASAEKVLELAKMTADDVDFVVPHQANLRIIEGVTKRLGIDPTKVVVNIERYGNTSSASIPIAFDEAVRDGRIKPGMVVLFTGLGGGLAWGATLLRTC